MLDGEKNTHHDTSRRKIGQGTRSLLRKEIIFRDYLHLITSHQQHSLSGRDYIYFRLPIFKEALEKQN